VDHQGQSALRASEEFSRRTNEVAGVGGWALDVLSGQIIWSKQMRRIHQVTDDFVPTLENGLAFYAPEAQTQLRRAIEDACLKGTPWDLELEFMAPSGHSIHMRAVGEAECDRDGVPFRVIGTLQDITDRKRLERQLEASERFIRGIADSIPARIAYLDTDRCFQFANRTVADRFGMSREQMIGRNVLDILPPVSRSVWEAMLVGASAGQGQRYEYDDTVNGQVRRYEVQITPDAVAGGEVRGFVVIGNDITHLKCVEQELRELTGVLSERTQALEQSREMFRLIAESTNAVPFTLDLTLGSFPYLGAQGIANLQLSESECAHPDILERVLPRTVNTELRHRLDASVEGPFEFLAEIHYPEGRRAELRWMGTCSIAGGHKILRGLMLDVTEVRRLERELLAAQKLESVGRLAGGVAHEINTPVQYVADNVEFVATSMASVAAVLQAYRDLKVAVQSAANPEAAAAAADRVESEQDIAYILDNVPPALASAVEGLGRIATIVRSLRDFAHPDQAERSTVDLNHAIRSTLAIASNEYKYVAELETDFQELPPVHCHLGEINRVILNLVVNAAHAIGDVVKGTGERGRITVRSRALDGEVEISVTDTGTGIAPAVQERIFDPFFTTKPVGMGTGQGLAIARSVVVNKHGGSLRFETELGKGTTFFMRMPLCCGSDAPAEAAA
jgi:PAS domain S-box-containing protein